MGFNDKHEAAAAITFLTLYVVYTILAFYTVFRVRKWRSPYTFMATFGLIRIGAQLSAVAFSVVGYNGIGWLIAYLILGAEGYFTLVLSCMYFLCYAEVEKHGVSYLRPTHEQALEQAGGDKRKALHIRMRSPAAIFHWLLIPSNTLIIVGGSQLSGAVPGQSNYDSKVHLAKVLRGTGQAMFLLLNFSVGVSTLWLYVKRQVRSYKLVVVYLAWPFLLARGFYGLLSVFIDNLNYFDLNNYTDKGLSVRFIAIEYILGATMEFVAASLLLSSYFFYNNSQYLNHVDHVKGTPVDEKEVELQPTQVKEDEAV